MSRRTLHLPGLLTLIAALSSAVALSGQGPRGELLPVHEVALDNGLRILVLPRRGAPTVSFVVQYAIGGVNEQPGSTGIAHLLEHLLFKGTSTIGTRSITEERPLLARIDSIYQRLLATEDSSSRASLYAEIDSIEDVAREYVIANEFSRILSTNGARGLNAITASESTIYFVELPANRLELWFAMEADRMANPVLREFFSERAVVMEERRDRVDTNPGGMLYEAHLAAAFQVHPYGNPVVGHMSDLERLSRQEASEYLRRYYGPNNAVIAIVGDVDADRVEALAREYLSGLARREEPLPVFLREPPQDGERRVVIEFDAEPQLRLGWHTVDALHDDAPALTMLSTILTGGSTSRLYRRLVLEEGLAAQVTSVLGPGERYPRLLQIDAIPIAPHTTDELEAVIEEELARLRGLPPTPGELEMVRNQIRAGNVRRLQSNLGLAFQLAGSASLHGDWRATFREADHFLSVTPADVQRVANLYLRPDNRTVATLVRTGSEANRPERSP